METEHNILKKNEYHDVVKLFRTQNELLCTSQESHLNIQKKNFYLDPPYVMLQKMRIHLLDMLPMVSI